MRASLAYGASTGGEAPGEVTYGEAFTVQPFNNLVVTQTFTRAQLQGRTGAAVRRFKGQTTQRILQPSAGLTYSYDSTAPAARGSARWP
ncbi:hypothetical protein TPA0907_02650 [Micromonospora humidisoli]|nr:hypothetical protein TPA0907_02650 [Micromonospora sp. AKA109]